MGNYEIVKKRLAELLPRLKGREIAIYPYGTIGRLCEFVLKNDLNLCPKYLVDNNCNKYGVLSFNEFSTRINDLTKDKPFLLFATSEYANIHQMLPEVFCSGFKIADMGVIFKDQILSYEAIDKVLSLSKPGDTLLDIGCGPGIQGKIFEDYGLRVTGLTMANYGDYNGKCLSNVIVGNLLAVELRNTYDVVWCSHMLEHFPDVRAALEKIRKDIIKEHGVLAITVPAREHTILLNHIHYFDAGRLLRYMLFAGFDCRNAQILEYGYNLSVILPECNFLPDNLIFENEASHEPGDFHDGYAYDDMKKLYYEYLPSEIEIMHAWDDAPYFDGDIKELNWYGKKNERTFF